MAKPATAWTTPTLPSSPTRGDWGRPRMNVKPKDIRSMRADRYISAYDSAFGLTIAEMVDNRTTWTQVP